MLEGANPAAFDKSKRGSKSGRNKSSMKINAGNIEAMRCLVGK